MNTLNIIRKSRLEIKANLIAGTVLLITGIFMISFNINIVPNNKAILGISLIPFAVAFSKWINLIFIKKYPKEMDPTIVSQNDERLITERNEAEANTNRIFRWLLNLIFMGYTLIVPADAFKSIGWWIVLALLCLSYLMPLIMLKRTNSQHEKEESYRGL